MFCQGDNISHNIRTLYASIYFVNKYQFSKMKVCSFKWCKKNAKSNKGTAFFQYPKCADMSRIWKEYTGYERNAKYATVCELHFKPEDLIVYEDGRKMLAQGAVPNYSTGRGGYRISVRGGRDFLGTKLFSGIRNKIQEKRYKTHKV